MKESKKSVIILIFALTFAFSFSGVYAVTPDKVSEDEFEMAKTIKEGQEYSGTSLKNGEAIYYQIEVEPGQQLQIFGSTEKEQETEATSIFSLYSAEKELLSTSSLEAYVDPAEVKTNYVYYLPGLTEEVSSVRDQNTVYFELKAEGDLKNFIFASKLLDKGDLGNERDAGDTVKNAMLLDVGDFKNNFLAWNKCGVNQYCSTDSTDVYKIKISRGETLTFDLKAEEIMLEASLLDENEKELAKSNKSGKGINVEYESKSDQNVYLSVEAAGNSFYGSYSLTVESSDKAREAASTKVGNANKETNANVANVNAGNVNEEDVNKVNANVDNENLAPVLSVEEKDLANYVKEEIAQGEEENFLTKVINMVKRYLIWVIVGIILLVILVVVIIVVLVKRGKRLPPPSPFTPPSKSEAGPPSPPTPSAPLTSPPPSSPYYRPAPPSSRPTPPPVPSHPEGMPPGPRPTPPSPSPGGPARPVV